MAVIRYTVVESEIISEKRLGARRFYDSDALGSTTALYDSAQAKTDSIAYWPYGEVRNRVGSTNTKYLFVGSYGCRTQFDGGVYMRSRVYRPKEGLWMTVDTMWPKSSAYMYALNQPTTSVDPHGSIPGDKAICDDLYEECKDCMDEIKKNLDKAVSLGAPVLALCGAIGLAGGARLGKTLGGDQGAALGFGAIALVTGLTAAQLSNMVADAHAQMAKDCRNFRDRCRKDKGVMCSAFAEKQCQGVAWPFSGICQQIQYDKCMGKKPGSTTKAPTGFPGWVYVNCPKAFSGRPKPDKWWR